MLRRLFKIVLILALLSCAAVGLRRAQGQRESGHLPRNVMATAASRSHREIRVNSNDGSFVLKNLRLERMNDSTILKGDVVNKTKRKREQVSFLVRAYNHDGKLLKGLEKETIFTAQGLKANASLAINHGYGVWLQGVSLDDIARVEISEPGKETEREITARVIPLASHALDSQRYAEVEE
jgi:hypothetical protein